MKDKIKEKITGLFNFARIDSDLTVWLTVDGKDYELNNFNIGFGQAIDFKGQPQDEVRGGRIILTVTQALPESMYQWAMTSSMKNGEIVFRSKTASAPLKVEFKNAFCVRFNRVIDQHSGLVTNIVISPEEITVNGTDFENHWV